MYLQSIKYTQIYNMYRNHPLKINRQLRDILDQQSMVLMPQKVIKQIEIKLQYQTNQLYNTIQENKELKEINNRLLAQNDLLKKERDAKQDILYSLQIDNNTSKPFIDNNQILTPAVINDNIYVQSQRNIERVEEAEPKEKQVCAQSKSNIQRIKEAQPKEKQSVIKSIESKCQQIELKEPEHEKKRQQPVDCKLSCSQKLELLKELQQQDSKKSEKISFQSKANQNVMQQLMKMQQFNMRNFKKIIQLIREFIFKNKGRNQQQKQSPAKENLIFKLEWKKRRQRRLSISQPCHVHRYSSLSSIQNSQSSSYSFNALYRDFLEIYPLIIGSEYARSYSFNRTQQSLLQSNMMSQLQ